MKFTATFKTPDAIDDAVKDVDFTEELCSDEQLEQAQLEARLKPCRQWTKSVALSDEHVTLTEDQQYLLEDKQFELREFAKKWSCGEYITVEFDKEAGTCTVLEA